MKKIFRAGAVGTVAVVALVGCATQPSGGSTTDRSADPIKIMTILTEQSEAFSFPQQAAAVRAHADAVNKTGGIEGRTIEVTNCNDALDPNTAAACARDAVAGEYTVVIQGVTRFGQQIQDILAKGKVPNVVSYPILPIDMTSPNSIPLNGGSYTAFAGLAYDMHENEGCSSIGLISPESASQRVLGDMMEDVLAALDSGFSERVEIADTTTDFAPAVAKATGRGQDCVILTASTAQSPRIIPQLRQMAPDVKIGVQSAALTPSVIAELGDMAEGIIVSDVVLPVTETDNPDVAQFIEEMKTYEPSHEAIGQALNTWAAAKLVTDVLASGAPTDPVGFGEAVMKAGTIDLGMLPAMDFSKPITSKAFGRLANGSAMTSVITDASYVVKNPKDPFFDLSLTLADVSLG